MTFLTGTGRHRAQIIYFFRGQLGSRTPSRIGLGSVSRLRRMRQCLGLPRELCPDPKLWHFVLETTGLRCMLADVSEAGSGHARGVGACACLVTTLSDLRETSGPRIDRFPSTRPPWCRRQYRDIQKLIFLAPRKRPIGTFGPLANRRILKRLHVASKI